MRSVINAGGDSLNCNDMNTIFFDATCNYMAPVFNSLASEDNPDFIVMSQYLNGDAKGWVRTIPSEEAKAENSANTNTRY